MSPRLKAALGLFALAALITAARLLHLNEALSPMLGRFGALGPAGAALFVAVYAAATVLFVPGSILTLGAGAAFGALRGFFLVWIGATLGAAAAFLVSRYFAREWVGARLAGDVRFHAVDEAVGREGWKIVGLARLTPLLPFNVLNYGFGLSRVSFRDYVLASAVGMVPGTAFYVYVGSVAGGAAGLGRTRSPGQWAMLLLGLMAAAAVVALITRTARRALNQRLKHH